MGMETSTIERASPKKEEREKLVNEINEIEKLIWGYFETDRPLKDYKYDIDQQMKSIVRICELEADKNRDEFGKKLSELALAYGNLNKSLFLLKEKDSLEKQLNKIREGNGPGAQLRKYMEENKE